ncbi:helix-turn-helix transcriptional regulator [Ensifer sp. HO-A22]|uniref:Helix-turn-helix transcriptional regulator n=1 Tax=Ensifer oleiphilus TaxID=2742698 RepID=A0A7Y6Q6K8_9HYPH|nr:XRE family transcriptional regulator [Ensifer oleiphilus]NVD40028.1 helix-turn-helix transcriptional regulator [Ensifer oleiphilus]
MTDAKSTLGDILKEIRNRNRWTLAEVSSMTGLAVSTLSKVENNQMQLTYDRLVQLAQGLKVDIVELFGTTAGAEEAPSMLGRRTYTRTGEGREIITQNYDYLYVCTEISKKSMVPIVAVARARTLDEFGPLIRHKGEEFFYVVEGELELHTEIYAPLRLRKGDSCYFDAMMGHAYLSVSEEPAQILCVCSTPETELVSTLSNAQTIKSKG